MFIVEFKELYTNAHVVQLNCNVWPFLKKSKINFPVTKTNCLQRQCFNLSTKTVF